MRSNRTETSSVAPARWWPFVGAWVLMLVVPRPFALAEEPGVLRLVVTDVSGSHLPCRIHLRELDGAIVQPDDVVFFYDHFVSEGEIAVALAAGTYLYEIERGHEFRPAVGQCIVPPGQLKVLRVELERIADMRSLGWYSGELHIHRPLEHLELLMRADDLDFGPTISWWNQNSAWTDETLPDPTTRRFDGNRFLNVMGGEDEREGGALLFFGLERPLPIQSAEPEFPSPLEFVELATQRSPEVWINIEKPFWWDVPVWIASGHVDSIGIANNHMCRSSVLANEAWGRSRDRNLFPGATGNGFWTQHIYYQILNAGIRIPPSAGSSSGVLPNPVGFNRVYVYLEDEPTFESWWEGLRAGRSFVTNGPLLDVRVDNRLPGFVFVSEATSTIDLELDVDLISNVPVAALELIHNGEVVQVFELDNGQNRSLQFTHHFDSSGWFLIRAMAADPSTFRFASTAPYYLELGETPQFVSRRSIQFFADWIEQRIARIPDKLADPVKLESVLAYQDQAKLFWLERLRAANAD